MRQTLISKVNEETGMWMGAAGFFIGIIGGLIAFTISLSVGYWIGLSGALIGLLGIVIHFVMNWRSIFRIDQ